MPENKHFTAAMSKASDKLKPGGPSSRSSHRNVLPSALASRTGFSLTINIAAAARVENDEDLTEVRWTNQELDALFVEGASTDCTPTEAEAPQAHLLSY